MLSFETARNIINKNINELRFPVTPVDLYDPIRYILLKGGKRIRPVLVLLSCDMFSKDYMKAIGPALGIEIFHNFTLIHDDLMDNANIRHNIPTVHIKWNPNTAILSGDAMSILAYQYISKVDRKILDRVMDHFNNMALMVCEGQMLDMNFESDNNVSLENYMHMIGLKTAVLIAGSLKMGAIVADASIEDIEDIYNFGFNLGISFQIMDDYLDLYGNEESFGKKIGNDIAANKKTFLLIKALELAKGKTLKHLNSFILKSDINVDQKIIGVRDIYNDLKIPEITEKFILQYYHKALENLKSIRVDSWKKNILTDLSKRLIIRVS